MAGVAPGGRPALPRYLIAHGDRASARERPRNGGLLLAIAGVALVLVLSFVDLHATRNTYVAIATLHGYLEIAMLGYSRWPGAQPFPSGDDPRVAPGVPAHLRH